MLPTLLFVPGTESDRWAGSRPGQLRRGRRGAAARARRARSTARGPPLARALARARAHARASRRGARAARRDELRPSPREALIALDLEVPEGETIRARSSPPLERFVDERDRSRRSSAHLAGISPLGSDINDATIEAIHKAELIAAPILIIVLLLVFRTSGGGRRSRWSMALGHRTRRASA